MIRKAILAIVAIAALTPTAPSRAAVEVVTSDTNLADIARHVGGTRVHVESLSRGVDDPHMVEPRPSMVTRVARAQLVVRTGMDLDLWLDGILEKSNNRQVMRGGSAYVDASRGIRVQEIPPARLDPSMGDIHVYGNPHYLMDPGNAIVAAGNITAGLIRIDPAGTATYRQQYYAFAAQIKSHLARWSAELSPFRGQKIVTYHRSWVYFVKRFGLVEFGTLEPKPGIPPSPGHVSNLVQSMKSDHVKALLVEDFRAHRYPELVASRAGAKIAYVPLAVEGEPGITNYFLLFDTIVARLTKALH